VKRPFFLIIFAVLFVGILLSGLSDTAVSIEGVGSPNDEVTNTISKASNSSASATITITMYAVADG